MECRLPKIGDRRCVSKFLIFPIEIGGVVKCFKRATWEESYRQWGWQPCRWLKEEEKYEGFKPRPPKPKIAPPAQGKTK